MRSIVPDYLTELADECAGATGGATADYIPELANVDPTMFGIALTTADGRTYDSGDADTLFTIQSVSKAFVYALAIRDRGLEEVLERIDVEPSGEAFNELSLERNSKRPLNPMINAGAITAHSLVGAPQDSAERCTELIIEGLSQFAGRDLDVDERAFSSEMQHAHRNLAIAHMLRSYDMLTADPEAVVRGYIRQCAVRVTTRDLSVMAATLANGGTNPVTGRQVVDPHVVVQTLSVMLTCGMYDSAGDWITTVGIPAKSGVGGGIIGALPGQFGVATFSPRLDEHGNSVRGVATFERLSHEMGMHLMTVPPLTRSVVRRHREITLPGGISAYHYELQGPLRFASVEQVIRLVEEYPPEQHTVVVDLFNSTSIDATARRMLLELMRRLRGDGHEVWLVDGQDVDDGSAGLRLAENLKAIRP
ncbi:glutaminase [Calidifontibacter terrae]